MGDFVRGTRRRHRGDVLRLFIHGHLRRDVVDGAVAVPGGDLPARDTREGERVGGRGVEYREWMAGMIGFSSPLSPFPFLRTHVPLPTGPPLPRHVRRHQRKDPLRLRRLLRRQHPHGLGPLPGDQSADARGDESGVCGGVGVELGGGEELSGGEGKEPAGCAGGEGVGWGG